MIQLRHCQREIGESLLELLETLAIRSVARSATVNEIRDFIPPRISICARGLDIIKARSRGNLVEFIGIGWTAVERCGTKSPNESGPGL